MLVLSRKENEKIIIGDDIVIVFKKILANRVVVEIDAPKNIPVHRHEIRERMELEEREKNKQSEQVLELQSEV